MRLFILFLLPFLSSHAAQIVERGPHHRVIEEPRPDGSVSRYTELRSSMHYLDQGQWRESTPLIEIFDGAAVARQLPAKVIFAANLNSPGAVDLLDPINQRFRISVIGLALADRQGNSVLIAAVRDCEGFVHENAVYFFDPFDGGFAATVQYIVKPGSCEQNVIIEERFDHPTDWGFAPDAEVFLEVWSEFIESPEPVIREVVREQELDEQKPQALAEPDLIDRRLNFGGTLIAGGRAFVLGAESGPGSVPTLKDWVVSPDGRRFLVEKIPYAAAEPYLRGLPAPQARARRPLRAAEGGLMARAFPPRPAGERGVWKLDQQAAARLPERGYVLDWVILTGSMSDITLYSTNTYYISGECQLSGVTRFEPTVAKFAPTNNASLHLLGPAVFDTAPYAPLICTARDDHTVGEQIGSANLEGYYAYRALHFDDFATNDIKHVRISHAQTAITLQYDTGHNHTLSHVQMDNCEVGFLEFNVTARLRNVLMHNTETSFTNHTYQATNHCEHLTVHGSDHLNATTATNRLFMTNCLLVAIGAMDQGYQTNQSSHVTVAADAQGVFQTVGASASYLSPGSTLRDAGTTNINAALAEELRQLTTYPPIVLDGAITMDTTLGRAVPRDQGLPDIGYHFLPLDYLADAVLVTNSTLRIGEGVAVGSFGATAFWVHDHGKLICQGSPLRPNTLVRYYGVQEGTTNRGTVSGTLISGYNHSNSPPDLRLRFTDSFVAPGGGWHLYANNGSGWRFNNVEIRDCSLYGGTLYLVDRSAATYGLTNNLFRRVTLQSTVGAQAFGFRNNLWKDDHGATLLLCGSGFKFYANLLDTGTLKNQSASLVHEYNAYYNASTFYSVYSPNASEQVLGSLGYESWGPWDYYQPSGSALIDAASVGADTVGFYHYTTGTNQVKEGSSTLDVGLHRIALGTDGLPLDSDADTIPDVLEDLDGDGVADAGETDWEAYDSVHGLGGAPALIVFTPLR